MSTINPTNQSNLTNPSNLTNLTNDGVLLEEPDVTREGLEVDLAGLARAEFGAQ